MSICTSPIYKLEKLNNLFIEMTSKNCNQRCPSCFIDFGNSKNIKDFISIDVIKEALEDTKSEEINCIYLSGAEPMTHPDFNSILRLCLKRCNVCISTNGSFLNEKKIRFLKKVEDEGNNQIFFKLSLTHFDEAENDKSKYRGNYRQVIHALKTLNRYNFVSVLSVQNYYNLEESMIRENFDKIFSSHEIKDVDIQITKSYPYYSESETYDKIALTDCMKGRVLSKNGIYSCPFLANDYRGRCGSTFNDYSKNISAETDFCLTCASNQKAIFTIG